MTQTQQTIYINIPTKRLRVRRVDESAIANDVRSTDGKWHAKVRNGGSVANNYGYRADTEAALAVSDPHGNVVVWMGRLPANKVTSGDSADACLAGARDLFDSRVTSSVRETMAWDLIKRECVLELAKRTDAGRVTEVIAPGALDLMTVADLRAAGAL